MKLVSCHIENFGKLHDFSLDFNDGLNVIYEENGWGKSTLIAFIKVMFYGFDERSRNELLNERKRYQPWQGGVYGGSLVFSVDDKKYRVERSFIRKHHDEFRLYDHETNMPYDNYSDNLGEDIFHISRESFINTCFIAQKDTGTNVTGDVHALIGDVWDDQTDINRYEKAHDMIQKAINKLSPDRKTGQLYHMNDRLNVLASMMVDKEHKQQELRELRDQMYTLQSEAEDLRTLQEERRQEMTQLSYVKDQQKEFERYLVLKDMMNKENDKLEDMTQMFPVEVPELSEVETYLDKAHELRRYEETMSQFELSDAQMTRYQKLKDQFADHKPTREEISNAESELNTLNQLMALRGKQALSDEEEARMHELEADLGTDIPDIDEINEKISDFRIQGKSNDDSIWPKLIVIISIAIIIGGIYVTVNRMGPGYILILLGFMIFLIAMLYMFGEDSIDSRMEDLEELYELREDVLEYNNLRQRYEYYAQENYDEQINSLQTSISDFLAPYIREKVKAHDILGRLKMNLIDFEYYDNYVKKYEVAQSTYGDLVTEIEDFMDHYQMQKTPPYYQQLTSLRDQVKEIYNVAVQINQMDKELKAFEETHDMEKVPKQKEEMTLEELTRLYDEDAKVLKSKEEKIAELERQAHTLEGDLETIHDAQLERDSLEDKYEQFSRQYLILNRTLDYLEQAKVNFTSQYMNPVKQAFDHYYDLMTGSQNSHLNMDANLNLSAEAYQMSRDTGYLSVGYQDLIAICQRMSMVDAMYENEKPFLILDDPFVNLDEDKIKGGMAFLKEVSASYQIIYLTCHESRM